MGWLDARKKKPAEKKPGSSWSDMRSEERQRRAVEDSKIETAKLEAELELSKNGSAWDRFWKGLDF